MAIKFQMNHPGPKAMTKVFQAAMDYRDSLDYSKKQALENDAEFRFKMMLDYCINTMYDNLANVIKKNFGLTVSNMYFNGNPTPSMGFFVDLGLGMPDVVVDQMTRISGSSQPWSSKQSETFSDILNALDSDTATLTKTTFGADRKIEVVIGFDQVGAFLIKDYTNKYLIGDDFTAEDLTAIILHEVGHVFTLIEHSQDQFFIVDRFTDHLTALSKKTSAKDIKDVVLPEVKDLLNYAIKKEAISKKTAERMTKVVETIDYTLRTSDEWPITIAIKFCALVISILLTIAEIVLYMVVFGAIISVTGAVNMVMENTSVNGPKISDTSIGRRNYYDVERKADEFVSKLGYGAALAASFAKLQAYMDTLGLGDSGSVALNRSFIVSLMLRMHITVFKFISAMTVADCTNLNGYETIPQRIRRLLDNNMKVFKGAMTADARSHYIKSTEEIMKTLKDVEKNESGIVNFFNTVHGFVAKGVVMNLLTGDNTNELDTMLREAERVLNTKFNYFGAKFADMAKNLKRGATEALDSKAMTLWHDDWTEFTEDDRDMTTIARTKDVIELEPTKPNVGAEGFASRVLERFYEMGRFMQTEDIVAFKNMLSKIKIDLLAKSVDERSFNHETMRGLTFAAFTEAAKIITSNELINTAKQMIDEQKKFMTMKPTARTSFKSSMTAFNERHTKLVTVQSNGVLVFNEDTTQFNDELIEGGYDLKHAIEAVQLCSKMYETWYSTYEKVVGYLKTLTDTTATYVKSKEYEALSSSEKDQFNRFLTDTDRAVMLYFVGLTIKAQWTVRGIISRLRKHTLTDKDTIFGGEALTLLKTLDVETFKLELKAHELSQIPEVKAIDPYRK